MKKTIVYGIPNCGSVKKAVSLLQSRKIDFEFHDYKKKGIDEDKLRNWIEKAGWEALFNKKGTTWKKLSAEKDYGTLTEKKAIDIMLVHHSIIKRPVIEIGRKLIVGFDEKMLTDCM